MTVFKMVEISSLAYFLSLRNVERERGGGEENGSETDCLSSFMCPSVQRLN